MLGDREMDESLVAELVKVSQTSVERTSVSLLLTAAGLQKNVGGGGARGGLRSEVSKGGACKVITGQVQQE